MSDIEVDLPAKIMRHVDAIEVTEGEFGTDRWQAKCAICIRVHFLESLGLPPTAVIGENVNAAKSRLLAVLQTYLFDVLNSDSK